MLSAARSVVFAMLVTAGVVTLVVYTRRGEAPDVTVKPDPERPTASAAELKHAPVGSAGCLAAACHGAPAEKALRREYDTFTWQSAGACWTAADPHTAAYFVLTTTDDDTKRGVVKVSAEHIMRNLHRDEKTPPTLATEDVRCVACHTNPALAAKDNWDKTDKIALRSEGVSCEACHGAAGGWQGPHYSSAFKNAREASYKKHGMAPLYDMGERAIACAGCHVGAPAVKDGDKELVPVRDMNHDMIAAGHPRLNFDFADFQTRLPRHWQEKKRLEPGAPPYEPNPAKVWLVGRAAHAEAACKLLADRVARAEKNDDVRSPWPEYAEFNCAACHHTLRAPADETGGDWRQSFNAAGGGRPLGVAPWQPIWPLTSASGLAWPLRASDDTRLKGVVLMMENGPPRAEYEKEMVGKKDTEKPTFGEWRRAKTAATASAAAAQMADLRKNWRDAPDDKAKDLALEYVTKAGAPTVPDWDSAAQLFWARAALARAKWNGGIVTNFEVVRNALRPREGPGETRPRPFPLVDWNELQSGFRGIVPMDE